MQTPANWAFDDISPTLVDVNAIEIEIDDEVTEEFSAEDIARMRRQIREFEQL